MKQLLILCALTGLLGGCATSGNGRMLDLQAGSASPLLQPGTTTRADAERLLGAGSVLRFESGWATERYVYRHGLPRFLDYVPVVALVTTSIESPETELVLLFDPDGVLRKFRLRAPKG